MTTTDLALVPPRTPIVTRLFGADPTLGAFGLLIALSLAVTLPASTLGGRCRLRRPHGASIRSLLMHIVPKT